MGKTIFQRLKNNCDSTKSEFNRSMLYKNSKETIPIVAKKKSIKLKFRISEQYCLNINVPKTELITITDTINFSRNFGVEILSF